MKQGAMLPSDFVHLFQDKLFLEATFPPPYYKIIGEEGCLGTRITFGPFCVEYYTGDKEPTLLPFRGLRLIIWTPIFSTEKPKAWVYLPIKSNSAASSCVYVKNEDYKNSWSKTFRNYKNEWMRQRNYVIKKIDFEMYQEHYSNHALPKRVVEVHLKRHERHYKLDKNLIHFYVLEHISSKEIVAGIATVNCPTIKQSYYLSAFTRKEIAPPQTGFWLLSNWMEELTRTGFHFANLGVVWTKGHDSSWKGFTHFKLKFNPMFIVCKRELLRFTFSL